MSEDSPSASDSRLVIEDSAIPNDGAGVLTFDSCSLRGVALLNGESQDDRIEPGLLPQSQDPILISAIQDGRGNHGGVAGIDGTNDNGVFVQDNLTFAVRARVNNDLIARKGGVDGPLNGGKIPWHTELPSRGL